MARSARIDAARGCAVFGILLVNIWGFVHGYALQRYTDLAGAMPLADQAVLFFVTAFAEQKFYPIFSFLFGAGFVLQTGPRRAPGPALDAIRAKYLRRVRWLLVCGVVHGAFFWFGDILTTYALLGFWLVQFAGVRLASLWRTLWLLVALNGAILIVYAVAVVATPAPSLDDAISMAYETQRIHAVYTQGGWLAIARERLSDYATNLAAGWIIWPRIALLFMLGVIAARMGCLTRPQRMRRFWRTLAILALVVGLPLNLWAGAAAVSAAMQPFAALPLTALGPLVQELAGPLLGGGYLAAFMLARRTLAAWLVPVGRMALTNYLMQSLIAMLTLQGFALGLGKTLGALHLMLLAFAIMAAQTLFSHWWMAHHPQGPMETWWRRYTDGKPRV